MSRTARRLRRLLQSRTRQRSEDVKYLLIITMNPTLFKTLSEEEKNEIFEAHEAFQKPLKESGELLGFAALKDPAETKTVKVRDDGTSVTDGPYVEAKEFLAGFYVVDVETQERANELAAQLPDAKLTAIEVRPMVAGDGSL
jgi:hypothetical protein